MKAGKAKKMVTKIVGILSSIFLFCQFNLKEKKKKATWSTTKLLEWYTELNEYVRVREKSSVLSSNPI